MSPDTSRDIRHSGQHGHGLQAVTATHTITGLNADTIYHFRVVATNAEGVTVTVRLKVTSP